MTAAPRTAAEVDLSGLVPLRELRRRELEEFAATGHASIDGLWHAGFARALEDEATNLMPPPGKANADLGRAAPSSQATAAQAPLLSLLHARLVPLARALTGRMLVPAFAWYNFYEADDGIWLHVDIEGSELVLLSTATGEVGPLHVHPALRGMAQDDLDRLQTAPGWDAGGGTPVTPAHLGVVALRGTEVPHHRPGLPLPRPGAVAALHYVSLF